MSDFTTFVSNYMGGLVSGTWSASTLSFIVDEALELYGVSAEADATDTVKAHALLRYKAMERFLIESLDSVNYSASGESFSLSQIPASVRLMWATAKREAAPYLSNQNISIQNFDAGFNPQLRSRL